MDTKRQVYAPDMPMGLDMALAKNQQANDYFNSLPDSAQQQIIQHTHAIRSKEEMQAYVDSLVKSNTLS
jgi:uncharacterized protein YdeI (YjbR/CyaY-like superfamily)